MINISNDDPRLDPLPEDPEPEMETLVASAAMAPEKKAALEAIVLGKGVARAAKELGIHRSTLYRWISEDAEFQTALANYRRLDRAAVREHLLSAAEHAGIVVRNAIRCGDVRASLALLRSLKMLPIAEAAINVPAGAKTGAEVPTGSVVNG